MAIVAVLQAAPPVALPVEAAVLPVVAEVAVPAVVSLQAEEVDLPVAEAVSPAVPLVAVLPAAVEVAEAPPVASESLALAVEM